MIRGRNTCRFQDLFKPTNLQILASAQGGFDDKFEVGRGIFILNRRYLDLRTDSHHSSIICTNWSIFSRSLRNLPVIPIYQIDLTTIDAGNARRPREIAIHPALSVPMERSCHFNDNWCFTNDFTMRLWCIASETSLQWQFLIGTGDLLTKSFHCLAIDSSLFECSIHSSQTSPIVFMIFCHSRADISHDPVIREIPSKHDLSFQFRIQTGSQRWIHKQIERFGRDSNLEIPNAIRFYRQSKIICGNWPLTVKTELGWNNPMSARVARVESGSRSSEPPTIAKR
jgi:hypothetical protein